MANSLQHIATEISSFNIKLSHALSDTTLDWGTVSLSSVDKMTQLTTDSLFLGTLYFPTFGETINEMLCSNRGRYHLIL